MDLLVIEKGCPNCEGSVGDERLSKGLPCPNCLTKPDSYICQQLKREGTLRGLKPFCDAYDKLKAFEEFFTRAVGTPPWSLQRTWAKRVLFNQSFAVVAPTGVGKTTFGLVMALFLEGKSLLVFPTKVLAQQAGEKLRELARSSNRAKRILVYDPRKKIRQAFLEGDFDILCGTNMFLHKNFENLMRFSFSFFFIDDIDSFLKRSKNVENLFKLLGFSTREIKLALKPNKSERDWEELSEIRKQKREKVLVVSSATLKPRGSRVLLFKNLLGFEVQRATTSLRNVEDIAVRVENMEEAIECSVKLIKELGSGGIVYLSAFYGKDKVNEVVRIYKEKGIKAVDYTEHSPEELYSILERGDFDVAVGISHISNPLVRGLDLPHVVRYALFLDTPKHMFPAELSLQPSQLHSLLLILLNLLPERDRAKAFEYINYLRRYLNIKEDRLEAYPRIKDRLQEIRDFLHGFLENQDFLRRIESSEDIALVRKEGRLYIVVGDAGAYIQASGRTSRLVAGKMTKGLSVLLYWDSKAFTSLKRRLSLYFMQSEVSFKTLDEVNVSELLKEIDRDRERARAFIEKKDILKFEDLFRTSLVIVESPNKARTIASFFGKPQTRLIGDTLAYEVPIGDRLLVISASLGHVLDLVTDKGFFGVVEEVDTFVPVYDTIKRCPSKGIQHTEVDYIKERCKGKIEDKKELIDDLRKISWEVDEVFIATDPDAEGEKIAYDLYLLLRPFNARIKRAEFHEVTKRAFTEAIENPRYIDLNLVKAQLTRRILDRWVGFSLSRLLWEVFKRRWFSAGRVQTPVLGWVIERYRASREKKGEIMLNIGDYTLKIYVEDISLARRVYKDLESARIYLRGPEEEERGPLPPYSTDTILRDTSEKLNLSAYETMTLLQDLFEKGLITYHRTDSTRVSDVGKYSVAKSYIETRFGKEFFYPRSWSEGGAHECIRPTRPLEPSDLRVMIGAGTLQLEEAQKAIKLYELIFKRFMASQMRACSVKVYKLHLELPYFSWEEKVVTEVIKKGFEILYPTFRLLPLKERIEITSKEFRKVPKTMPFTQGTLIQEMRRRGLGRPSTYAHIVQTLLDRGYVKEVKGSLVPTDMGIRVFSYLRENYPQYVSEELTRKLEKAMDEIERGELDHIQVLKEAYKVKELLEEVSR